MLNYIKNIFSLDLRTIALVRVMLAILAIIEFFHRIPLVDTFYSDRGILPRFVILENFSIPWKMSLLFINGESAFSIILLIVGIIAGFLMAIGLHTKKSQWIVWIILLSFHGRFPDANHGGDNLLRILLFIMLFLPTAKVYSVDHTLTKFYELNDNDLPENNLWFDSFTLFWFIQIFVMYGFTFYYKWDPVWFKSLDSVYYALNLELFTTSLGMKIKDSLIAMKVMSFFAFWLEGIGPLFLLIPWKNLYWRYLSILSFISLHTGIWLTLILGNFPIACIILWIMVIPAHFWELCIKYNEKKIKSHITLYYDEDCGFCKKICLILKDLLLIHRITIKPHQSNDNAKNLLSLNHSWVLEIDGNYHQKFLVLILMLKNSHLFLFRWIGIFLFWIKANKLFGDKLYTVVSHKRQFMGKILNTIRFQSTLSKSNFKATKINFKNYLGIFFVTLTILWNLEGTQSIPWLDLKSPLNEIVFSLQLNQQWNMFAPKPMRNDGFLTSIGTFENGVQWDVVNDEQAFIKDHQIQANYFYDGKSKIYEYIHNEMKLVKDKKFSDYYPNSQMRKFVLNMYNGESEKDENIHRLWFARSICRKYQAQKLKTFKLYFLRDLTPPPQKNLAENNKLDQHYLWEHFCN